ncbi:TPA: 50S ribosomal protein L13 [Candidatus Poribacteria bacterium]|nr:50S ribosomal protein L13 [Candidatus Poribacteria bacterium]
MKTYFIKSSEIQKKWYVVNADGKTLGRLTSQIASILRGKHKPTYTPHADMGDNVIVVNAEKVRLTGKKADKKVYYRHTGYPGGIKFTSFNDMIKNKPERVIEMAVKGMLPHNRLGRAIMRHLKVYRGPDHPHQAQQPEPLEL